MVESVISSLEQLCASLPPVSALSYPHHRLRLCERAIRALLGVPNAQLRRDGFGSYRINVAAPVVDLNVVDCGHVVPITVPKSAMYILCIYRALHLSWRATSKMYRLCSWSQVTSARHMLQPYKSLHAPFIDGGGIIRTVTWSSLTSIVHTICQLALVNERGWLGNNFCPILNSMAVGLEIHPAKLHPCISSHLNCPPSHCVQHCDHFNLLLSLCKL